MWSRLPTLTGSFVGGLITTVYWCEPAWPQILLATSKLEAAWVWLGQHRPAAYQIWHVPQGCWLRPIEAAAPRDFGND